jgi:hypothetical protein
VPDGPAPAVIVRNRQRPAGTTHPFATHGPIEDRHPFAIAGACPGPTEQPQLGGLVAATRSITLPCCAWRRFLAAQNRRPSFLKSWLRCDGGAAPLVMEIAAREFGAEDGGSVERSCLGVLRDPGAENLLGVAHPVMPGSAEPAEIAERG